MWDYLYAVNADSDYILDVSPSEVVIEEGDKNCIIHTGDDGSEDRISLSNNSILYVILIWRHKNASDAGTIFDYYHDSSKGNGRSKSFRWSHPTDGHLYTVRFADKLSRKLIDGITRTYTFDSVKLRVLGAGDKAVDASDVSSNTEVGEPTVGVV